MKKLAALVLGLFLLVGCGANGTYKKAVEAKDANDHLQVIELLDTIPDHEDSEGLRDWADSVVAFRDAVVILEEQNAELDTSVASAQELMDSCKIPLEESLFTNLQVAVSGARAEKKEVPIMPSETVDILVEIQEMGKVEGYTGPIAEMQEAKQALENSIQQMEQITNPTGDFVIERISEIETVGEIQGVTEDNDPNGNLNKQGGYTSTTYFTCPLIDQSTVIGNSVTDKGTDGGGCVEVYKTVEDALARDSYLAGFDNAGMFSSGSHYVYGTLIIRTSDILTATQQTDLTEQIFTKLIELR